MHRDAPVSTLDLDGLEVLVQFVHQGDGGGDVQPADLLVAVPAHTTEKREGKKNKKRNIEPADLLVAVHVHKE